MTHHKKKQQQQQQLKRIFVEMVCSTHLRYHRLDKSTSSDARAPIRDVGNDS